MKLIVILSLILLNIILTFTAASEKRGINYSARLAGKNYKGIKTSKTEYYQNEFFEKCNIKTGNYNEQSMEVSYKCKDSSGIENAYQVKLDNCLNAGGGRFRIGFGFQKNTKGCKVDKNWIKCKAMDGNGKYHVAKFNLNFVLYFMKDMLTCGRNRPWIKKP